MNSAARPGTEGQAGKWAGARRARRQVPARDVSFTDRPENGRRLTANRRLEALVEVATKRMEAKSQSTAASLSLSIRQ